MLQGDEGPFRAQTIELFFDLVFVFTITQITHLVEHAHSFVDDLHAFAVLMLVWWMYGGFIWLTNHAHTPKRMRLVLIAALAGFLIMALSIPESAGDERLVFGLAYLAIVLLHYAAFVWQGGAGAARAMLRIVPFNIAAALLVISSGLIEAEWSWLLLLSPVLLYLLVSLANTGEGFSLDVGHFVERHGLLLIIVLGEIVIAVGNGMAGPPHDAVGLLRLLLAVALVGAIWWSYFDREDGLAEHRMAKADNRGRTRMALFGYNAAHLFMIAGLILVAAGLKFAVGPGGSGGHASSAEAAYLLDRLLPCGLALYLLADAVFRRILGFGWAMPRLITALLFAGIAAVPHGPRSVLLLALAVGLLVLMLMVESRRLDPSVDTYPQSGP